MIAGPTDSKHGARDGRHSEDASTGVGILLGRGPKSSQILVHNMPSCVDPAPSMLKIFAAPSSVALATLILLEEVEADYELHLLDFAKGEQRESTYQAINPKGRVPAIVTEDGILTETPAILVYVAQRYGSSPLIGAHDPFIFAKVQEFNSYLASTVHVAHAHRFRGSRWADDPAALEAMKRKVPETMTQSAQLIETDLLKGPWVHGDAYTVCDPYLFTVGTWLEGDGVDTSALPKILAHRERMLTRPATQAALKRLG